MNRQVAFTREALKAATPEQIAALNRMNTDESGTVAIDVQRGGLGLPVTWLTFRRDLRDGSSIYGGIDPDGQVST